MIVDKETNILYLADSLPKIYPAFYNRFKKILVQKNINCSLLPKTKDVWAVDFMPIQLDIDRFIKFHYNPDYLQGGDWLKTISDVDSICQAIGLIPRKSNLIVDGGNVVKAKTKAIMCDKVFKENSGYIERQLIKELEELLEVDKIIFIPTHPKDTIGHADGMVRFLNDDTVLINSQLNESAESKRALYLSLHNAGLNWLEIPYNPYSNRTYLQANGIYINYLQMKSTVFFPIFGMNEDEIAFKLFEQLFTDQEVVAVESKEIANQGGVLNCISWNILV